MSHFLISAQLASTFVKVPLLTSSTFKLSGPKLLINDRLSHFKAMAEELEHLHASVQRTQVLINTTKDLSGVLHTLAPFLL